MPVLSTGSPALLALGMQYSASAQTANNLGAIVVNLASTTTTFSLPAEFTNSLPLAMTTTQTAASTFVASSAVSACVRVFVVYVFVFSLRIRSTQDYTVTTSTLTTLSLTVPPYAIINLAPSTTAPSSSGSGSPSQPSSTGQHIAGQSAIAPLHAGVVLSVVGCWLAVLAMH